MDFDALIAAQKGKVVLVDFWASWCSPCRKEMPVLNAFKKKMDPEKFVVISISIDKEVEKWEKAVVEEGMEDFPNSYVIYGYPNSPLVSRYNVSLIPRYMLFDKEGNLVDKAAVKPSNEAFETTINGYM